MSVTEKNCPECDNHCPADALKCERGEKHFGIRRPERDLSTLPVEERILMLFRKCGHHLHHNVGREADAAVLMGGLNAEEKAALDALLQKCLKHWQEAAEHKAES